MLKVMKMDLILSRDVILINAAIFGAALTFFAVVDAEIPPRLYAGWAGFMMAFLPALLVTREDKFDAMRLGCSLPVKRKTIVQGRYALSLCMALVGIVAAYLLAVFVPKSTLSAGELFTWGTVQTSLACISIVLSLILPFILRFGMKGLMIFLIASQVLGVVLLTLTRVLGSSADKAFIASIFDGVGRVYRTLGPAGFNLFFVAFLAALLALSYLVSVRVFQGREL